LLTYTNSGISILYINYSITGENVSEKNAGSGKMKTGQEDKIMPDSKKQD